MCAAASFLPLLFLWFVVFSAGAIVVVCIAAFTAGGGLRALRPARALLAGILLAMCCGAPAGAADIASAVPVELRTLNVSRSDDGVLLDFAVRFELPKGIEEGLNKGVPLYFVAEAEVMQSRWYWLNKPLAHASRTWRLAYQPLTRHWRVSVGGLHQRFETLAEALSAITRASRWRVAEPLPAGEEGVYIDFSYRLDATQLPRPLQIGLDGQADWALGIERRIAVPNAAPGAAARP